MSNFTFPGHKYLGPGNPLNNGQPVDKDDEIAAIHDRLYENAETTEDIYRADKCAICEFLKDAKKNKNWHSMIGAAGLCAKHAAEKALGRSLYPFNLPRGMCMSFM